MIFIDMDGTLTKWEWAGPDVWMKPGYFEKRPPQQNVIDAVEKLVKDGYDVKILSSVIGDAQIKEKNIWLDKYLPCIDKADRYYVPYDFCKSEYIGCLPDDVLLDDYSENLHSWAGIAIKCRNNLNGTKGTWTGYSVSCSQDGKSIANTIKGIIKEEVA